MNGYGREERELAFDRSSDAGAKTSFPNEPSIASRARAPRARIRSSFRPLLVTASFPGPARSLAEGGGLRGQVAAKCGQAGAVRRLLRLGSDVAAVDLRNWTALHYAAQACARAHTHTRHTHARTHARVRKWAALHYAAQAILAGALGRAIPPGRAPLPHPRRVQARHGRHR